MGLGCNAAGVVGCRIIDSPRERNLAVVTNSFIPCNGRFGALIFLLTAFLIPGEHSSALAALGLTGFLVLGVGMTLVVSRILSATVLKGLPSSFALELPPFRRPRVGQVIVRSVLDRTLRVLFRAVMDGGAGGATAMDSGNSDGRGAESALVSDKFSGSPGAAAGHEWGRAGCIFAGATGQRNCIAHCGVGRDRDVPTGCRGNGIGFCVAVGRL